MDSSRLLRLFCIALVGGLLAGALVTVLLGWWHRAAASGRSTECSRQSPTIVLLESPS